jgi:hypothetical protein
MADCMEHCSRFRGDGEGCFGVVWREDFKCWMRNSNTTLASLEASTDSTHSAYVIPGTMDPISRTCPEADLSTHTLDGVEGLAYTMHCGKDITGIDPCWSGIPKPCWDMQHLDGKFLGFFHTRTLEECLRICIDQNPLCKAVSWNPGMEQGFANCWPKAAFADDMIVTPGPGNGVLHSATITSIDRVDTKCPSEPRYSALGNHNFDIHCGQLSTAINMTSLHSQNITSCMDSCASTDKCVGVVFDSTLQNGFKNCYLQNTTLTVTEQASATYAVLGGSDIPSATPSGGSGSGSGSGSNSGSSSSTTDSPSKAWIAGPVIGGLAAIAIIGFVAFWWRRRKAGGAPAVEKDSTTHHYGAAPAYSPVMPTHQAAGTGYYDQPSEVDGQNMHNELPGSTKYAHAHTKATEPQELA